MLCYVMLCYVMLCMYVCLYTSICECIFIDVKSKYGAILPVSQRRPSARECYRVLVNKTICSMLGLCRVHVGGMLGTCWF